MAEKPVVGISVRRNNRRTFLVKCVTEVEYFLKDIFWKESIVTL